MYRLSSTTQRDVLTGPALEEATHAWQYANTRLADATAGLAFDPVPHVYKFGGVVIPGVSSIVEHFDPFDVVACAERCSKNRRHEMFGKPVEDILAIWERRGAESSDAGTTVHEFGEACFLCKAGQADRIEGPLKERLAADGTLEAASPKEEAVARWWDSMDLGRYVLIAKETRVYNPQLRYAGTFDVLLYDLLMHSYALKDYKTNKDLFRWYGDYLRAPLSPLKANDEGKYTVQQNLYRIELENIGLKVGSMDLVWLKEDGTFQEVPLSPEYGRLVSYAAGIYLKEKTKKAA